jgi:N-methylhydantoinase B
VREIEVLAPEATISVRIDAVANPPWGVSGGQSARGGRAVINPGTPQERVVPPISDGHVVRRGDRVRIETGGGGGWGDPFDREPERVLADVRGGFVSREAAARDYGVVIAADGRSVDEAATRSRRAVRPATRLFHRRTYADALT